MGRLDDIIARNRQHLAPREKRKLDKELNLSEEAKKTPKDTNYPGLQLVALTIIAGLAGWFYLTQM